MFTLPMAVSHATMQPELLRQLAGPPVWKADCVVQVTSLGSEAKLAVDFADVYASSQLAMCAPINTYMIWIPEAQRHPYHQI